MPNGDHTFKVQAIDKAGNTDASPASRTWTVAIPAGACTITGTAGNDVICGGGGNGSLIGNGGNDTLKGGAGNDSVKGDSGSDNLFGDTPGVPHVNGDTAITDDTEKSIIGIP